MFFFNRSSDERDQLASASKSFETILLALPNEKSLGEPVISCPITIAWSPVAASLFALTPTRIFLSPVVLLSPASLPTATLLNPVVFAVKAL